MNFSEVPKRLGTLSKADIVKAIYEESDKSHDDCAKAVESLLNIMIGAIAKDQVMLLSVFGKFECYFKNPRKGRSPRPAKPSTWIPAKSLFSGYHESSGQS